MTGASSGFRSLATLFSLLGALHALPGGATAQTQEDAGDFAPPPPPSSTTPPPGTVPPPPPSGYGDPAPPAPGGTALYPAPGGTTSVPPPGGATQGYPAQPGNTTVVVQPAQPTRVRYRGGPIPDGAYIERQRRPGLYIPGLVIFGLSYFSALYDVLVYPEYPNTQYLAIPVFGPIIYGSREQYVTPYLVMNSLMQAAGLVLFAAGFQKKDYLVIPAGAQRQVALAPFVGPGSFGVGLSLL